MSGETEEQVSGWTVDTLHSHMVRMLNEQDRRIDQRFIEKDLRDEQRFQALQRAIDKADGANEKRFEGVNEFRQQLGDQARTFLPRLEYDRAHTDLIERVDQMRVAHGEHLSILDQSIGARVARSSGVTEGWGYVFGVVGVLIGIVSIIIATRGH